jgi:sugar lactone lactonase YvrE
MRTSLFSERQGVLGEAPLWDDRCGRLYWVDIRRCALEWKEGNASDVQAIGFDVRVSALGIRSAGGLIAAADHSVGVIEPDTCNFEARVTFEGDLPRNRTNDGGVGADGRFWFGTMDDGGEAGRGALYSVSSEWKLKRAVDGLTIPNGIVINAGATVLLAADSGRQVIEARALDPITGLLSPPREWASFADGVATPDGAALDEEGCLWSALWDGGAVVRLTPDGRRDRRVVLPVPRPTSCAFGGPHMRTLYVTSARDGLSEASLMQHPLSGSVFAIDTETRGLPVPAFTG